VHVSHLANRFIKDPNDAVQVGQVVKVKVLSADPQRKRIALSIKEAEPGGAAVRKPAPPTAQPKQEAKITSGGLDLTAIERAGFRVRR